MSRDDETLAVYTEAAALYAEGQADTRDIDQQNDIAALLGDVPDGGHVLDLGCGPGQWAVQFRDRGYRVTARDATPAMAELAQEKYGLKVEVQTFDALDDIARFDAIWANFSLLHAPKADFPGHLARLHRALRRNGALHLGMKLGTGEARDALGRFYSYYQEDELVQLVTKAGFDVTRTRRGNGQGLAGGVETFVILTATARDHG